MSHHTAGPRSMDARKTCLERETRFRTSYFQTSSIRNHRQNCVSTFENKGIRHKREGEGEERICSLISNLSEEFSRIEGNLIINAHCVDDSHFLSREKHARKSLGVHHSSFRHPISPLIKWNCSIVIASFPSRSRQTFSSFWNFQFFFYIN